MYFDKAYVFLTQHEKKTQDNRQRSKQRHTKPERLQQAIMQAQQRGGLILPLPQESMQ